MDETFDRTGWRNVVNYATDLVSLSKRGFAFGKVEVKVPDKNIGLWLNKKGAASWGFQHSDFVIVIEDDILLNIDALQWFEWHVYSGLIFTKPDTAVATCWSPSFPRIDASVDGHDYLLVKELGLLDKFAFN
jgi:hypothetical protein